MFAEIAVNVPNLASTFHYSIPPPLRERLTAGHLVTVPFGARRAQGIAVGLAEAAPVAQVKEIEGLVDPAPVLTRAQLDLAYWISHTYLASLVDCLTLMLPPGLSKRADVLYSLIDLNAEPAQPAQQSLVRLLKSRGPLRGRQIDRALPRGRTAWRSAADALARRGVLTKQSVLAPPTVRPKHIRSVRLSAARAHVMAAEAKPGLSPRSPAKAARLTAVLDFLADEFDPVDVSWVYAETSANLQDLKDLAERGLVELGETEVWRDSLAGQQFVPSEPLDLTPDQQRVWEAVAATINTPTPPHLADPARRASGAHTPILLHGVTGSGKTEIYLRALDETLAQHRRAIVLVPEIALTPQTVRRFAARFPGRIAVWHSQLSDGERYDTWRRARLGMVDVVIGPRSALFAPLADIGLIVLDEEHDESYKQDPPFAVPYHAREAAVEYARRLGAICLLGSATPDVVSYARARQGAYRLLELPQRIMGHTRRLQEQADQYHVAPRYRPLADGPAEAHMIDLPQVEVVDLRQELRAGNTSIFSRRLQAALAEALARREQAILFLNRRGTATFVFCRDCGQALKCPRCEMPLTYHGAAAPSTNAARTVSRQAGAAGAAAPSTNAARTVSRHARAGATGAGAQLVCHHCNMRRTQPERCPNCGSRRIKYFGSGTEKVQDVVRALLPGARTLRWDYDVTRFQGAHDLILQQFSAHEADVLIGTQMIAKGLDLPLVTLVGVISADVGLGLPDYRATERTFQTLTQVAGRAGRGLLGGRVVLQTYLPDHYAIQAAARHNYAEFFALEMRHRKELGYPPFRRVMRLVYRHPSNERAEAEASVVAKQLLARIKSDKLPETDLAGPTPCFFGKIAGDYRWQVVVRGPDPAILARGKTLKGWYIDVDPVSTL